MVYFYKSPDNRNNILLYRTSNDQCILKAQVDGKLIPLVKCSNTVLSNIFSKLDGSKFNHVMRLGQHETNNVIEHVLSERPMIGHYKPTCMMNYRTCFIADIDNKCVQMNFEVYFTLWQIDPETHTSKEIVTEKEVFDYSVPLDDFRNSLVYIILRNDELAYQIITN